MIKRISVAYGILLGILFFGIILEAVYTIRLNQATAPGSGSVGQSVAITGGPYPANVTVGDLVIHISTTCMGFPVDVPAITLTALSPTTKRATFTIPNNVNSGQNYAWVTAPNMDSSNCSSLVVN